MRINIKKLCEKNKLEVTNQHGHSLITWQVSLKVLPKEKVNQSSVKVIQENEHDNFKIQTFTPSLSNDEKGRDVPLHECYYTKRKVQIFLLLPQTMFLTSCPWCLVSSISQVGIDCKMQTTWWKTWTNLRNVPLMLKDTNYNPRKEWQLCLLNPMKNWSSSKWNLRFQVQNLN